MIAFIRYSARAAALGAAAALFALASGTVAWEMTSYSDFIHGRFYGVSLSRDGRLSLAPKVDPVFTSDQPVIWTVAEASDGTLYAGSGHRGRVYRIDPAGKSSLLWTAEQPEIFAIAVDSARAAPSTPARLPMAPCTASKTARRPSTSTRTRATSGRWPWAPTARCTWGPATRARSFAWTARAKGNCTTIPASRTSPAWRWIREGRLLAGAEPNGILYRISAKDKAFVLYDSNLPEIRAIVPMPDGTVYAAALGGSVAKRAQAATQAAQGGAAGAVPTVTTSITVEAQAAEIKPPEPKQQTQQSTAATAPAPPPPAAPAIVDVSGVDKSAVYRINPDNTVETLWSSKEENVYDLLALERQLLFSTDVDGRIYGLSPDRRVTLVTQTNEGETTRLLPSNHSILAATGDMGRIFRLGETPGSSGSYEAPVHDSGSASRWGGISWRADTPAGCALAFRTRSGNSAKPDRTWSDWSAPLANAAGSPISSPNARYIQWKVDLTGSGGATPVLDSVTVAYLPRNSPPVVKSINVVTQSAALGQAAKSSAAQSSAPYSITVTDTADSSATSAGTPTQTLTRASSDQISIAWQAEDPDGDRLVYDVYFRGEDETQWKLLKSATHDTSHHRRGPGFRGRQVFL